MNTYRKVDYLLKCARLARQFSATSNTRPNYYELLGVNPKATNAEIKNAYYEKTKLYHPDAVTPTEESLNLFRQISEAYEVLGSPLLRKDYDENVLGIVREDNNLSEEDPISLYRKQQAMKSDTMHSWTQNHYNKLRKQQYSYKTGNVSKTVKRVQTYNTYLEAIAYLSVTLGILAALKVYFSKTSEKSKIF